MKFVNGKLNQRNFLAALFPACYLATWNFSYRPETGSLFVRKEP